MITHHEINNARMSVRLFSDTHKSPTFIEVDLYLSSHGLNYTIVVDESCHDSATDIDGSPLVGWIELRKYF